MLQIDSFYDECKQAVQLSKAAKYETAKKAKAAKTYPPQLLRRSTRPAAISAAQLLSSQPAGSLEEKSPVSSDNAYSPDSGGTGVLSCTSMVGLATPSFPQMQTTQFSRHTRSLTFACCAGASSTSSSGSSKACQGFQPEQPGGLKEDHLTTVPP